MSSTENDTSENDAAEEFFDRSPEVSPAAAISLSASFEVQKQYIGAPADAQGEIIHYQSHYSWAYSARGLKGYAVVLVGVLVPKPEDNFYPWPYYLETETLLPVVDSNPTVHFEYEGPEPTNRAFPGIMRTTRWHPRGGVSLQLPLEIYRCFQLWRQLVIPENAYALGELRWQPNVGLHSLIEVLEPAKAKAQDISMAWRGLKVLQALSRRGRPIGSGNFSSFDDVLQATRKIIATMRQDRRKITEKEVAMELGYDPKYYSDLLHENGLSWKDIMSRNY